MHAHDAPLDGLERAPLVQDRIRDPELSDVVQEGNLLDLGEHLIFETHQASAVDGERNDRSGMV
jgi:hypothetical protein